MNYGDTEIRVSTAVLKLIESDFNSIANVLKIRVLPPRGFKLSGLEPSGYKPTGYKPTGFRPTGFRPKGAIKSRTSTVRTANPKR